ncbi:MAG TPA: hypothetical protein VEV17_01605 [Bryobacteraceae bacterium]|nr:hypothetical protein [Bryobacteraceae bacterium]
MTRAKFFRALMIASVIAPACLAQLGAPFVTSVVNAASYSNGGIAQGAIFTVLGYSLGPDQLVEAEPFSLPFELAGTSIQITAGAKTYDCPMVSTSYSEVSAILPSNTPLGDAMLTPSYQGVAASFFPTHITVVASSFGIYSTAGSGLGPGLIAGSDGTVKTFDQPANPGDVAIARGTGLGAVEGGDSSPPANTVQFPKVEVFVGNSPATVVSAGRSQCCAGQDEVAFQVPDSPSGCFVPVAIRTGGTTVSNFVTLPVAASGEPCTIPPPGLPAPVVSSALAGEQLNVGILAIGPVQFLEFFGFSFAQNAVDNLSALLHKPIDEADVKLLIQAYRARRARTLQQILSKYGVRRKQIDRRLVRALRTAAGTNQQGAAAAFGTAGSLVDLTQQFASSVASAGTCMVTRFSGRFPPQLSQSPQGRSLDAGATLTFNGPNGQNAMPGRSGVYQALLGGGFQSATVPVGSYAISGTGGADVGPFTAALSVDNTLIWTNKSAMSSVDRSMPLTLTWSGGPTGGFVLIGAAVRSDKTTVLMQCTAQSEQGSFTIPDFVLSALPAADAASAYLSVGPHPFSSPMTIPGLDLVYFANLSVDYVAMEFR